MPSDDEDLKLAMEAAKLADTPFLVDGAMLDAVERMTARMWEHFGEIEMIEYFAEEFVEGEAWYRANFGPDDDCIIMLNKYYDLLALGLVKDWSAPKVITSKAPKSAKRRKR